MSSLELKLPSIIQTYPRCYAVSSLEVKSRFDIKCHRHASYSLSHTLIYSLACKHSFLNYTRQHLLFMFLAPLYVTCFFWVVGFTGVFFHMESGREQRQAHSPLEMHENMHIKKQIIYTTLNYKTQWSKVYSPSDFPVDSLYPSLATQMLRFFQAISHKRLYNDS